jgi:hypothetical protein
MALVETSYLWRMRHDACMSTSAPVHLLLVKDDAMMASGGKPGRSIG